MKAEATYARAYERTAGPRGGVQWVKSLISKAVRALTFNADAIFKSKDWPALWPK